MRAGAETARPHGHAGGHAGFEIAPIVFGGNVFFGGSVFGWTIDEKARFDVLDAFVDHGFDAIDTADVYSAWAPGNKGGAAASHPAIRGPAALHGASGSGGTRPGGLDPRDVDPAHGHHGFHRPLRGCAIRVLQCGQQEAGHDLP